MVKTLWIFCLGLAALLASCGDSNFDPKSRSLSIQESQRYFPFNDGNLWVSKETVSTNGTITENRTWVTRSAGTKLVGNVIATVMSEADVAGGTVNESSILNDDTGITNYGNNSPPDALTAAANPYPYKMVNFPIQVGESFKQFDKTGLDSGHDLDGDGKNELLDITLNVVVQGFESVTTAAGTFQNCLRIETNINETVTFSYSGTRAVATGVETDWYAQDIGPVKRTFAITGNGQSTKTSEELTGYIVDGRSAGLSLKSSSTKTSLNVGDTAQITATLCSGDTSLLTIPATWMPSITDIVTIDSSGVVTGNKSGTVTLTPMVGGVAGQSTTITILQSFSPSVNYPAPTVKPTNYFYCSDSAMGDLNGDGRNDVAVMEYYGSRVLVYYQKVDGKLDTNQVITSSLTVTGIAIRDVNNDGFSDLIISGNSRTATSGWLGRVVVYRQNPVTHLLDSPQEYILSTNTAGTLAIADLNNDGLSDIVIASANSSGNGTLSFFFQGAGGALTAERLYTSVPIVSGGEVHVADMNSDGLNDIVVQSGDKQLAIIKQTASGVYSTSPEYYNIQTHYSSFFYSFALGDLNGDGRADIVVADPGNSGRLNIFLQNSLGRIDGPTLLDGAYLGQGEVKIADIDGDGLNDMVVYSGGYVIDIYLQSASHTFQHFQEFFLSTHSQGGTRIHQAMVIGDVTGDGLPDVVTSWSDEGLYVLSRR